MAHPINWSYIGRTVEYFQTLGYKYVEAPWFVSEDALKVTLPKDKQGLRTQDGPLVGSAEQAFIQLMMDGKLPPGKYVASTPCFRDDEVDELHQRYFMKVELIEVGGTDINPMIQEVSMWSANLLQQAYLGFRGLESVKTEDGTDLQLNGYEIGSYGVRQHGGFQWVYGTAIAEPRFTQAANRRTKLDGWEMHAKHSFGSDSGLYHYWRRTDRWCNDIITLHAEGIKPSQCWAWTIQSEMMRQGGGSRNLRHGVNYGSQLTLQAAMDEADEAARRLGWDVPV